MTHALSVQELSETAAWKRMPAEAQQRVMSLIINAVTDAFKAAAVELVDTITKTQASLSKIGRVRNTPNSSSAEGPTDIEKMQEQLRLDVLEYGHAMEKLCQQPVAQMTGFQELLQVAKKPIQAAGAISPATSRTSLAQPPAGAGSSVPWHVPEAAVGSGSPRSPVRPT
jgi:hypothetical protein